MVLVLAITCDGKCYSTYVNLGNTMRMVDLDSKQVLQHSACFTCMNELYYLFSAEPTENGDVLKILPYSIKELLLFAPAVLLRYNNGFTCITEAEWDTLTQEPEQQILDTMSHLSEDGTNGLCVTCSAEDSCDDDHDKQDEQDQSDATSSSYAKSNFGEIHDCSDQGEISGYDSDS